MSGVKRPSRQKQYLFMATCLYGLTESLSHSLLKMEAACCSETLFLTKIRGVWKFLLISAVRNSLDLLYEAEETRRCVH
jgi:hypothetical protein